MAHPIPVSATVQAGQAPLDDLRLDLFMVTQDGTIAKAVGSFPVVAGVAEVPDVPLADPALKWAIRITDARLGAPVYRSGPLARLPGGPRRFPVPDHIRIHRGGGHLGLDAPDGAPQVLIDFVRDHLPPHFSMRGLDMEADAQGRYVLTFRGRYAPLPFGQADLEYRRRFRTAPAWTRAARPGWRSPGRRAAAEGGLPCSRSSATSTGCSPRASRRRRPRWRATSGG